MYIDDYCYLEIEKNTWIIGYIAIRCKLPMLNEAKTITISSSLRTYLFIILETKYGNTIFLLHLDTVPN